MSIQNNNIMQRILNLFFILLLCTEKPEQMAVSAYTSTCCAYRRRYISSTHVSSRTSSHLFSTVQQDEDREKTLVSSQDLAMKTEEDDWEYEEYEVLQESDFYNSEWKVGTLWDNKVDNIDTTWCRLVLKDDQNVAIWGDGAVGKWSFDVPSQFLGISKDSFGGWLGKKIWAGVVDDFYYIQGTVRGWSPISPASVLAQWQAKRLGFSEEETGIAPWFQEDGSKIDETVEESR